VCTINILPNLNGIKTGIQISRVVLYLSSQLNSIYINFNISVFLLMIIILIELHLCEGMARQGHKASSFFRSVS